MILIITIITVLLIISAFSKSIMDAIQFHHKESIFSKIKGPFWNLWFNPSESWKLKWKNGDPFQGERFPGSSTIFVWITDAWHFFQMMMLSAFQISIILAVLLNIKMTILIGIIVFASTKVIYGGIFELFWKYIWKIK